MESDLDKLSLVEISPVEREQDLQSAVTLVKTALRESGSLDSQDIVESIAKSTRLSESNVRLALGRVSLISAGNGRFRLNE